MKFSTKAIQHYPPHISRLLHYYGTLKSRFCRHLVDIEENANKVHFKFTDFNSSMRATVYAECIYALTKYLKYLVYET